jgi:hypothetical protein
LHHKWKERCQKARDGIVELPSPDSPKITRIPTQNARESLDQSPKKKGEIEAIESDIRRKMEKLIDSTRRKTYDLLFKTLKERIDGDLALSTLYETYEIKELALSVEHGNSAKNSNDSC